SAEEPSDRTEMHEARDEPSERSAHPFVREKKRIERPDHEPLDQDAVYDCYGASDNPSQSQGSVLPSHLNTPLCISATFNRRYAPFAINSKIHSGRHLRSTSCG